MKKSLIILIFLTLILTACGKDNTITSKKNKEEVPTIQKEANNITEEDKDNNIFNEINYYDNIENIEHENNENESATVTEYIESVVQEGQDLLTEDTSRSKTNESKLRNTFITLTDFIFYNGKIKGYTFDELKDLEKERVISAWEKLDSSIEKKYPNYKEKIEFNSKKTYVNLSDKAKTLKEKIKDKSVEAIGEEAYNETIEQFNIDKENLIENTKPYVEIGKNIKDKAKYIYEDKKSKLKNWYENYKKDNSE